MIETILKQCKSKIYKNLDSAHIFNIVLSTEIVCFSYMTLDITEQTLKRRGFKVIRRTYLYYFWNRISSDNKLESTWGFVYPTHAVERTWQNSCGIVSSMILSLKWIAAYWIRRNGRVLGFCFIITMYDYMYKEVSINHKITVVYN